MRLLASALLVCGGALLVTASQERGGPALDGSAAFWRPAFAAGADVELAKLRGGALQASTYLRYLAARHGTAALEDLAFDVALARACAARGLLRSAPVLARSVATQRLQAAQPRAGESRAQHALRVRNEALRQLRVDALVQADREVDEDDVRAFYQRLYGVGGRAERVRHVLVSFAATRRRLEKLEKAATDAAVDAAARARAAQLHERLQRGEAFAALLPSSDDRATRRMLRDPQAAPQAGIVSGYDQQRYGEPFARALRDLAVGEVSAPVRSRLGYHLIEVLARGGTAYEDVAAALRRQIRGGKATPSERRALRQRLLREYGFAPVGR